MFLFYRLYLIPTLPALLFCTTLQAHDGTVNITGTIRSNTCTVSQESNGQTVQMGQVASNLFNHAGTTTPPQSFTLNLLDCGSAVNTVAVTFTGTPDQHNRAVLALDSDPGCATGIGIELLDKNKDPLPLSITSPPTSLPSGQTTLSLVFYAQYIATGSTVMAGTANASATFTLVYS